MEHYESYTKIVKTRVKEIEAGFNSIEVAAAKCDPSEFINGILDFYDKWREVDPLLDILVNERSMSLKSSREIDRVLKSYDEKIKKLSNKFIKSCSCRKE